MSTRQWFPLYIKAYLSDTYMLTTEQHGAYLLLLIAYWDRQQALPDDDQELASLANLPPDRWDSHRKVLSRFFEVSDGQWRHDRVEKEILEALEHHTKKKRASEAGHAARYGMTPACQKSANGISEKCERLAPIPVPPPQPIKEINLESLMGNGDGNGVCARVTIKDPNDRIARFQSKLAKQLGPNGWTIIFAATSAHDPNHVSALRACKGAAKALGKGWPLNWPVSP